MMAVVQTELDRVMRRGRRVFQPSFVLYYLPLSRKLSPRIVVSQKVDKRSVVRHKVKRRIRHILIMDKERIWQTVLGEIEVGMSPANFQTWFKNTALEDANEETGVVIVRDPNDFTKSCLQKRHQKEIHKGLQKHLGKVVVVQYVVGGLKVSPPVSAVQPVDTLLSTPDPEPESPTTFEGLNPRLTFANFVVGENSRLCHAAAESVAQNPGINYNPLFIYGDSGL